MSTLWYLDVESSYIYLFKNGTKLNRSHGGRPSSDDRAELGPVLSVSVNKPDGKLKVCIAMCLLPCRSINYSIYIAASMVV